MVARLVWFAVVAVVVAFATQTFFARLVTAEVIDDMRNIRAQHSYINETHDIRGMVMVPTPCHDLTVRARDFDAETTVLVFETWEQPYRICDTVTPAPKEFNIAVFAPQNIKFKAILDHEWAPLTLLER